MALGVVLDCFLSLCKAFHSNVFLKTCGRMYDYKSVNSLNQ